MGVSFVAKKQRRPYAAIRLGDNGPRLIVRHEHGVEDSGCAHRLQIGRDSRARDIPPKPVPIGARPGTVGRICEDTREQARIARLASSTSAAEVAEARDEWTAKTCHRQILEQQTAALALRVHLFHIVIYDSNK